MIESQCKGPSGTGKREGIFFFIYNPLKGIHYAFEKKSVENHSVYVHFLAINLNSDERARGMRVSQAAQAVPAPSSGGAAGLSFHSRPPARAIPQPRAQTSTNRKRLVQPSPPKAAQHLTLHWEVRATNQT